MWKFGVQFGVGRQHKCGKDVCLDNPMVATDKSLRGAPRQHRIQTTHARAGLIVVNERLHDFDRKCLNPLIYIDYVLEVWYKEAH